MFPISIMFAKSTQLIWFNGETTLNFSIINGRLYYCEWILSLLWYLNETIPQSYLEIYKRIYENHIDVQVLENKISLQDFCGQPSKNISYSMLKVWQMSRTH